MSEINGVSGWYFSGGLTVGGALKGAPEGANKLVISNGEGNTTTSSEVAVPTIGPVLEFGGVHSSGVGVRARLSVAFPALIYKPKVTDAAIQQVGAEAHDPAAIEHVENIIDFKLYVTGTAALSQILSTTVGVGPALSTVMYELYDGRVRNVDSDVMDYNMKNTDNKLEAHFGLSAMAEVGIELGRSSKTTSYKDCGFGGAHYGPCDGAYLERYETTTAAIYSLTAGVSFTTFPEMGSTLAGILGLKLTFPASN